MKQQITQKNENNKELARNNNPEQSDAPPLPNLQKIECNSVINAEKEALKSRRQLLFKEPGGKAFDENSFGLALSGGGIRSATINLGFMKTLNDKRLLERADYVSTVSGGGYAGAYLHSTLKALAKLANEKEPKKTPEEKIRESYEALFQPIHIQHMRERGEYLVPGKGSIKIANRLVLIIGYLSSLVMSLLAPVLLVVAITSIAGLLAEFVSINGKAFSAYSSLTLISGALAFSGLLIVHYLLNKFEIFGLYISLFFHRIESTLFIVVLLVIFVSGFASLEIQGSNYEKDWMWFCFVMVAVAFFIGFIANPNASSFHRFYRGQLSEAFLEFAAGYKNVALKDLFKTKQTKPEENNKIELEDYINPYPLINTCLNLQSTKDPKFQGTKTNDYFLLSPLYCGAKLTGYVPTETHKGYQSMTLPAATTISAAALNPGMGIYSNKFRSVFLTLFNARLGYWTWNPMKKIDGFPIVWWPPYFFYELFSQIGTNKKMLNISDGGHIENLAVYELLRRKCQLIVAIDAGEDPTYAFTDLENLTIRSRNELGIDIQFLDGQDPEDIIRPKASFGYSRKRFAVAGLYKIWEEFNVEDEHGALIRKKDKTGEVEEVKMLVNYAYLTTEVYEAFEKGKNQENNILYVYVKDKKGYIKLKVEIKDAPNEEAMKKMKEAEVADYARWLKLAAKQAESKFHQEAGDRTGLEKLRIGTLVYVKSSVTAPEGKPNIAPPKEVQNPGIIERLRSIWAQKKHDAKDSEVGLNYAVYKYKIYHPAFPHEPTSDQFFDEVQWEAYYQLGQHLAKDMLSDLISEETRKDGSTTISLNELIAYFARPTAAPPAPTEHDIDLSVPAARGIDRALPKAPEPAKPVVRKEDDYYKI